MILCINSDIINVFVNRIITPRQNGNSGTLENTDNQKCMFESGKVVILIEHTAQ